MTTPLPGIYPFGLVHVATNVGCFPDCWFAYAQRKLKLTVKWDEQHRFLLTRTSVVRNAPEESGVYGLYSPGKWVYIGHGSNIRKALLDYLSGRRPYVLQWQPKYFVFECLHYKERSARNKELVARYQPVGNRLHRFK